MIHFSYLMIFVMIRQKPIKMDFLGTLIEA